MKLLDAAEKAMIFNSKDPVSKVTSKMLRLKKHSAVIVDSGKYRGVITAFELAKSKINNPAKTKIRKFVKNIKPFDSDSKIFDIIKTLLINDYKAIPIKHGRDFYILSKLAILKIIRNEDVMKTRRAKDIMNFPYCVDLDDSISTAISILRETGINRLPVLDKKGKAIGLIDTIDFLRADITKKRPMLGELAGERIKSREKVLVSTLMKKNIPFADPDTKISELINLMVLKKISTTIIEENGKVVGIVTPKPIMRLISKPVAGVYARISGIQDEDTFIKSVIDEEMRNLVRKLAKFIKIDYLVINVDGYHKKGKRTKYTVKARLITEKGFFFSDDYAWDLTKAIQGVLQKLERKVIKKKEKQEAYRRGA